MGDEQQQLERAIVYLETLRDKLGDAAVKAAIGGIRQQLVTLEARKTPVVQQRRQVTVLFADISGFALVTDSEGADEINEILGTVWQRLDSVIMDYGGLPEHHIDDTALAIWGVQATDEDDPERAIRAALAMQEDLKNFVAEVKETPDLNLRIGLHTGPVVLSTPGNTDRFTAIGDPINLASHLRETAQSGNILISHETFRHVRGIFDMESPGAVFGIKGRTTPVKIYRVLRARPRAFRIPSIQIEGIETRLIGRNTELKQLQKVIEHLYASHKSHLITITGTAGIGKSRLLYEFYQWLDLMTHEVWIFYSGSTMQKNPYSLMRTLLEFRFDIQESDSAAVVHQKFIDGFISFMGNQPEVREKARVVAQLVGVELSDDKSGYPAPDSSVVPVVNMRDRQTHLREQAFQYLVDFFYAVNDSGSDDPIVILLEDIHRSDIESLQLIRDILSACQQTGVICVGTARPELFDLYPAWESASITCTRIELQALTQDEARQLVNELLQKVTSIPPFLYEIVISRAEGNPFYIEELIKMLIDEGVIVKDSEKWDILPSRLVAARVPQTLTGVLQTRLDKLSEEERQVLQQAATIGRIFWNEAVIQLNKNPREKTHVNLKHLVARELIEKHEPSAFVGTTEYRFKSPLLHDIVYGSLVKRQKREYHEKIAVWLIGKHDETISNYASLVAEHYEKAGLAENAVDYLIRAGEQAFAISGFCESQQFYERALVLLPESASEKIEQIDKLRIRLHYYIARAAFSQGQYETALTHIRDGLTRIHREKSLQLVPIQTAILTLQGTIYRFQGEYRQARFALEGALSLAESTSDEHLMADALIGLSGIAMYEGNYDMATAQVEKALEHYRQLNDRAGLIKNLSHLGIIASMQQQYEKAITYLQESMAIAGDIGNRNGVATALLNLGEVARMQGDFARAMEHYTESLAIYRQIGSQMDIGIIHLNIGQITLAQNKPDTAAQHLRMALKIFMERHSLPNIIQGILAIARLYARQENYPHALELLGLALNHPALEQQGRDIAEPLLESLRANPKLDETFIERMLKTGKNYDLDKMVQRLIQPLETA